MRRLAYAFVVVLGLGCNDNSHPDPLKNELPNGGFVNLSVGQGAVTTTTSSSGGFGGFGSSSTGAGVPSRCDCVAAYNASADCQTCFATANGGICGDRFTDCFESSDLACGAINAAIKQCGADTACQRQHLFDGTDPTALALYDNYLDCVCPTCAADCAVAIPTACTAPPATSSSTGGLGGGFP